MIDFISVLRQNLPKFSKVLEIGSKKGEDLQLLHEYFEVVASEDDKSKTRYLKDEYIDIRVILLDYFTLDTHKKFDVVFSKNIYDEVSLSDLNIVLKNQSKILNTKGYIFHIFDSKKVDENEVLTLVNENFEIVESNSDKGEFYFIAKLV
ncbi:MAG: hypothetical protein ACQERD_00605 [Campylobacterota bacterium]